MKCDKEKFEGLYEEAKVALNNPESFRKTLSIRDKNVMTTPYPDRFAHKMTYYKAFISNPKKLENYILSQENSDYSLVREFEPTIIDFEPNSSCNFRCIMCHVSTWENGKRTNDITFDQFKEYIDNNPSLLEVKLHGMGEPFLHKEYTKMIQYLSDNNIWSRTSTNGSMLHVNDNYKKIIDAGIGEIQCSFDATTKEIYDVIRPKSNFDKIVKNLTLLNEYANTKDRLYTRMWVLVQENNRHQIFEFVEYARRMGFKRLSYSITINDWGRDEWREKNSKLESNDFSLEEQEKLLELGNKYDIDITVWKQSSKYSTSSENNLCPWVFNRPYITCDLEVIPCSMIGDPRVKTFGNAKEFSKTWNNNEYQAFRKAHLTGKIPDICKGCYKNA